ncbi:MAG: tetratricopeptide repeat protein, partial [Flavobacteriales bacterium]|nr:tetratricopeptide repeat protein [Flavobacteriales bacterium]
MQKHLTFFIALVISFSSLAQVNLDSLWNVWNDNTQPDTSRLKAMKEIAWDGYLFSQPDSAFYFAGLQYNFAESVNNKDQMAAALNTQGVSFYLRSDYANAIEHYTRSLKIREELGDKKGTAGSLNNIGVIYNILGDYVKAIDYYAKSLKIDEELGNKKGIAMSLNNIGSIYKVKGDFTKAIDSHARSLKIYEELGEKEGIALSL